MNASTEQASFLHYQYQKGAGKFALVLIDDPNNPHPELSRKLADWCTSKQYALAVWSTCRIQELRFQNGYAPLKKEPFGDTLPRTTLDELKLFMRKEAVSERFFLVGYDEGAVLAAQLIAARPKRFEHVQLLYPIPAQGRGRFNASCF